MGLGLVVLVALLRGASEVLPISASGHAAAAAAWFGSAPSPRGLDAWLDLAIALALIFAMRVPLAALYERGVVARQSAAARDVIAIALASGASIVTSAAMGGLVAVWLDSPLAAGLGLCVMGVALASTLVAPRPRADRPGALGAIVVGLAHGLAAASPGGSRVGAAAVLLLWLGVRAPRAIALSLLITIAPLLVSCLLAALASPPLEGAELDGATILLGMLMAFLTASVAATWLQGAARRLRMAWFALWLLPLGLATIAYARALSAVAI